MADRPSGLLLRRARAQASLLIAVAGVVLPAVTLLVLITIHAGAAERDGVRSALSSAPASQRDLTIRRTSDTVFGGSTADYDNTVQHAVSEIFGSVPFQTDRSMVSIQYNVGPAPTNGGTGRAVYFWSTPDITSHAKLVAGNWPSQGSASTVDVAVPARAATQNGWRVGDVVGGGSGLTNTKLSFRITGILEPVGAVGAGTPFWGTDQLAGAIVDQQGTTSLYGPLITAAASFDSGPIQARDIGWTIAPDLSRISPSAVGGIASRLENYAATAPNTATGGDTVSVGETLDGLLRGVDQDRKVSDTLLLSPVVQLVLLALVALLITMRLLAEHRRETDSLLRARGASLPKLLRIGTWEGLAVAIPIAAASPWLAGAALGAIRSSGWFGTVSTGSTSINAGVWLVAAGCALLVALIMASAGARAGGYAEAQRVKSRSAARTAFARTGADLLVVGISILAYWELSQHSGSVSGNAAPFVVAAPALLLLGGALLALRLLPVLAWLTEQVVARRRGLGAALASWQAGRRARRNAAPLLLLMMAIAIGVQAICFLATADRSAHDRAELAIGADARTSAGYALSPGDLGVFATAPGTGPGMPVIRGTAHIGQEQSSIDATMLGVSPDTSAGIVHLRGDLGPKSWPALAPRLRAAGSAPDGSPTGIPLPGRPDRITLSTTFTSATSPSHAGAAQISAVIVEADGEQSAVSLGQVVPDGKAHTIAADVKPSPGGRIIYPLRLAGLLVSYGAPTTGTAERISITAGSLSTSDGTPGGSVPAPQERSVDHNQGNPDSAGHAGTRLSATPGTLFSLAESTGYGPLPQQVSHLITFGGDPNGAVPVIATGSLLTAAGLKVGQTVTADVAGEPITLRAVASITAMPGTGSTDPAMAVAAGPFEELGMLAGTVPGTTEWWASAGHAGPAQLAAELDAAGGTSTQDTQSMAKAVGHDPLRGGLQLALEMSALAAALFIVVAFAVQSVIAARERAGELAMLRALGTDRKTIATMLIGEQVLLIGLGTIAGGALAVGVARAVVPHMILTSDGTSPLPSARIVLGIGALAAVFGATALILLVVITVVVVAQSRRSLTRAALPGEER